ncbi:MAG: hypothetical protein JWO81_3234 [Alphaproteobacteria bacterium]|nr:hypothetical protein [Alphaproteobacteria bacterium]
MFSASAAIAARSSRGRSALLLGAAILLCPQPLRAQGRTSDNAVTQAADAFGYSVGRESLGIYNAGNARGFSPTAAGNLRLEGLYFAPVPSLSGLLVDSTQIRVGLSAQGYPFVAPSGIVDQILRRPGDRTAASVLVNLDGFGSAGVELDGSLPVSPKLSLGFGLNAGRTAFPDGTNNLYHSEALIVRWRPLPGVEILPFWSLYNDYDDEASPFYVPAGSFLPPQPPAGHFYGPWWDNIRYTAANYGAIGSAALAGTWRLRAGAFRSVNDQRSGYTNLRDNLESDGTGHVLLFADPPHKSVGISGEIRLTHSIADGPRLHEIHFSLRGRDTKRVFGGSDAIDLGESRIDEEVRAPRPPLTFAAQSRDEVRQTIYGLAYDGRWKDVGELSFGVSRSAYRKTTTTPDRGVVLSRSQPWLYNATLALFPVRRLAVYAGYARGLEESGTPPPNAANRTEGLPAILTRQADAGFRLNLTPRMKAVAGLFDLRKPYFGFDTANRYVQIGAIRSRGAEFSLSGSVTDALDIVAGGVLLDASVIRQPNATGPIGRRPVGIPAHILNVNVNWKTPLLAGLSLDASLSERGTTPGTTDNAVEIPSRARLDMGARYTFSLAGSKATARLQVSNVFDNQGFSSAGPGAYFPNAGRYVTGYLAVDL